MATISDVMTSNVETVSPDHTAQRRGELHAVGRHRVDPGVRE